MTESPQVAAEKIALACYGRSPKISRLHSENNTVFLLAFEDGDRVLKIERDSHSQWRMKKEISLISLIRSHGIPAPIIEYVGINGDIIPEHWFIMSRAGDLNLQERYELINDDLVRELFTELGRMLGRIHTIRFDRQGYIEAERIDEKRFSDIVTERFEQNVKELAGHLTSRELQEATELFEEFEDSNETCLCHADFGPWQAIIDDGRISAIIDWEWAESSDPVYDFAKAELLIDVFSGNTAEFRTGYTEVQKLPENFEHIAKPYRVVEALNLMNFFKNNPQIFGKTRNILNEILANKRAS